jgi:two-component system, OmpR family, response regulator CpxR
MTPILIIDDDVEFCAMLRDYLTAHEIQLTAEHDGTAGLAAVSAHAFEMVLLDIMLPGIDGLEVLSRLKQISSPSVLLLSAQGSEANRILGLEEGADDYLAKPFNPRELVARIRAVLRRSERGRAQTKSPESPARDSGLAFDFVSRKAFYRGKRLPLTDVEFALLNIFLGSPGTVLDREDLVARVLQRPFNPLDRSLDMHISRLRRKLAVVEEFVDPIKTIRSAGYVFSASTLHSRPGTVV